MLFEKIQLEKDEQILLMVRRHWFILFSRVLGTVVVMFLPLIAFYAASFVPVAAVMVDTAFTHYSNQILFVVSLWMLISWMSLAYVWTDHYLDLWVVTDRRIISIDQKSLFVRSVGSFRLERLQDMNIEIPGLLATIFDYGHIQAQTASGSEDEFSVHNLPKPREIKAIILQSADQRMRQTM